jgi:hypothetical protein
VVNPAGLRFFFRRVLKRRFPPDSSVLEVLAPPDTAHFKRVGSCPSDRRRQSARRAPS